MTRDEFNAAMWAAFVQFAWSEPRFRDAFTAATGTVLVDNPASPMDQLIDSATGAVHDQASQFVEWVTRNHWGLEYAPKAYREAVAKGGAA